ncbi:MAG: serine/threonine-protein kinase [Gemmatimonadales bacterium]
MTDPIAGLNAALADHYVVDRELGRGGMAVVYLARDIKHERFVALKTLRPEIAQAVGRDRFLREIRLAARLQHPNILAVYDSGDAAGVLYYVMPYVEGESLRDRLEREPQLPIDDALQITREVSEALTYAHSHDVVHRDIKPENIMLSGGHAIVADFGIARAISAAGGDKLTETGLAIGTPAYMSPEQAAGTGQVDRRSDIYSLACVLYEMLGGQPPFTGPTAQAIMARHSLDSVPRLKIVRELIPDALEAVINRALAKVPADRYQTAAQFAAAIAAASTGRVSPVTASRSAAPGKIPWRKPVPVAVGVVLLVVIGWILLGRGGTAGSLAAGGLDPQRVAVLYFTDLSPDSSLGHLADGLTEAVIEALAPVRPLDVISPNGVAQFRGSEIPRDSIARLLRAGTLLAGSIEPEGSDRLRVTTRLVEGVSGADYARRTFALPRADLLAIRDSAVQDITSFLRQRLGEEFELRDRRAETSSAEAWSLVQRAERLRKEAEQIEARDRIAAAALLARADSLLVLAENSDPRWSEPIVRRAWVAYDRWRAPADREARVTIAQQGLRHAERAVALDGVNPRALEVRGTLRYALLRLDAAPPEMPLDTLSRRAQRDLEAAVRSEPTLAQAHWTLSWLHHLRKDVVTSILAARAAYEADAYLRFADAILDRLFHGSYNISQFAEARRWCAEGNRRLPRDFRFLDCQVRMLLTPDARPQIDLAWQLAARMDSLAPIARREFFRLRTELLVAGVIARAGRRDSALAVVARARAAAAPEIDPTQDLIGYEALVRTLLGERDAAMALLKRYVAANPGHSFEIGGDIHWWWRDLRSHPDFRAVLATQR